MVYPRKKQDEAAGLRRGGRRPKAQGETRMASSEPAAPVAETPTRVSSVTPEERHRMIAEAAYYLALKKGPQSDPHANWLEAEAEINARLLAEGRL